MYHKIAAFLIAAVAAWTAAAPAASAKKTYPTCPNGTTWADGCKDADINSVFQTPTFFTCTATQHCALAPGQVPYAAIPPWNVAGVNYPVGYDKTITLQDPTVAGTLPPGCSYNASVTAPLVTCANVPSLTLAGFDFGNTTWGGQTTGNGCVGLRVENISGPITISDNRWFNGPDKVHGTYGCGIENSIIVYVEPNNTSTDVQIIYNYCDINGTNAPAPNPNGVTACFAVDLPSSGASVVEEYNACFHAYGRCSEITVANGSTKTIAYNYGEGFSYQGSALHAEFDQGGAGTACTSNANQLYNTVLQPAGMANASVAALIYASSGAVGPCYDKYRVRRNSVVAVGDAATGIEVSYNTYDYFTLSQNDIAPIGTVAGGCIYEVSNPTFVSPPKFAGNINMLTGHTVTMFGVCL